MKLLPLIVAFLFILPINAQDRKSVLDLSQNNDFSSFQLLDSAGLENYNLFFTGEDHRYRKSNSDLEFKFFKYLYNTAGVRVFMVEFGPSLGHYLDKYINQGDTTEAKEVLKSHSYKEYYDLYTNLKNFNDSLPAGQKFRVVAVDIEREPLFAVKQLDFLMRDKGRAHDSISVHVDALRAVSEYYELTKDKHKNEWSLYDDEDEDDEASDTLKKHKKIFLRTWGTINLAQENFERHKEYYKQYLGADFAAFEEAFGWIAEYKYWEDMASDNIAQGYITRERKMEKNIEKIFNETPGLKAYGQFGRCHTQLKRESEECSYYYFNSLATRLNTGTHAQLAGKVFSCPVFYPHMSDFIDDKTLINKGLKNFITNADEDELTLFLLDSTNTEYTSMAERFDAVIINNLKDDETEDKEKDIDVVVKKYKKRRKNRILILGTAGVQSYNFDNLNNALGTDFVNEPQFWGFSLGFSQNNGASINMGFNFFKKENRNINDSLSVSLTGSRIFFSVGRDFVKSTDLDFIPWISIGTDSWTLQSEEKYTDPNRKDIFGSNRTTQFTNPSLTTGVGADLRIHLRAITLGVFGGYQYDLSPKNWERGVNKDLITTSPKFTSTSYTIGFSFGFNISGF